MKIRIFLMAILALVSTNSVLGVEPYRLRKQNIKIKDPAPTLEQTHPSRVLIGDPNLISELTGRVVIFASLSYGVRLSDMKLLLNSNTKEHRDYLRSLKDEAAQYEKPLRDFRADFCQLRDRLKNNPNVRCVSVLDFGELAPGSSPRPESEMIARAEEIPVTNMPCIELRSEAVINDDNTFLCVRVFDSTGKLCYHGSLGTECDKAIRDALKPFKP